MAIAPPKKYYGPEYEARVAADKKARADKKAAKSKARAEKKASRKAASKKRREAFAKKGPIKTSVQKSPKGKGSPKAPKVSKLGKDKPTSVVKTKGGDYPVYKKKSKKAGEFREAFAAAKGKDFEWKGRKYSGKKASDKKASKPDVRNIVKNLKTAKKSKSKKPASKPSPTWGVEEPKNVGPLAPKSAGGKDAWKAPEDKYRTKKQLGGMVEPSTAPSYKEGGKVENPYGWPSKDARNGGKK